MEDPIIDPTVEISVIEGPVSASPYQSVLPETEGCTPLLSKQVKRGDGGHELVVDQPDHYKHGTFEVIDELIMVFGLDATINFCLMNAWKYRARAPFKNNMEQDMEKADRYMQYAHDLQLKKAKAEVCTKQEGGTGLLPLIKSSGKEPVAKRPKEGKKHGARS